MAEKKISYKKTLIKGVKYFAIFGLASLVKFLEVSYPNIYTLGIGGALVMIVNMLKVKFNISYL